MRSSRKTPGHVKVLAAVFLVFALYVCVEISPLGEWLELKDLERQVKRNIDPMELQQWATNLLAQHSGHFQDFDGTNLPPGLKRVIGFGQDVETASWKGEREVWVFAGRKGSPFLVVGAPSLVNSNFVPWKPGIYFIGQH